MKKKEALERERQQAGLSGRTKQGVMQELEIVTADFDAMKENYIIVRNDIKTAESNLEKRTIKWIKQLKELSTVIARNFDVYMQKKGQSGTVVFDHHEKTLRLEVYIYMYITIYISMFLSYSHLCGT